MCNARHNRALSTVHATVQLMSAWRRATVARRREMPVAPAAHQVYGCRLVTVSLLSWSTSELCVCAGGGRGETGNDDPRSPSTDHRRRRWSSLVPGPYCRRSGSCMAACWLAFNDGSSGVECELKWLQGEAYATSLGPVLTPVHLPPALPSIVNLPDLYVARAGLPPTPNSSRF